MNLPDAKPKDWTIVVDDCIAAPYAFNGPYWIGYDNEESIKLKAQFVNFLDIAGAMVWSIDTDDFRGDYGPVKFPLLHVSIYILLLITQMDMKNHSYVMQIKC